MLRYDIPMNETPAEPKNTLMKEVGLASLVIILSFLAGYFWQGVGSFMTATTVEVSAILELVTLFLLGVTFSLFATLATDRRLLYITALIVSVSFFIFYPFKAEYLTGMLIVFLCFVWGYYRTRNEMRSQVRLVWRLMLRGGLRRLYVGVAFAFAMLYFFVIAPSKGIDEVVIPKPFFKGTLTIMQAPLQGLIPGFRADAPVDDVIYDFVAEKLKEEQGIDVSKYPRSQVMQFVREQRIALSQQLGVSLTGKETTGDLLYNFASDKVNEYSAPYKRYVPALLSIGYFITLQFFFYILSFVISLVFPLFVSILAKVGFLERKRIMVEKEIISIS